MTSLIRKITTPPLLGMIGVALFMGWCIGFVAHHASADTLVGENNVIVGRDFMAFYIGGTIILDGQGEHLYEPALQQETQNSVLKGEPVDGFSYYINPASVAVAYSLLARLPYTWAFYLHTFMMLAFLLAGVWILRTHLARDSLHWLTIAFLAACWLPMTHAMTGGQNASLCFLLLSVAYVASVAKKQWLAGLALGLLLFKPQYAVPVLGLLLLRKQFVTLGVAAVLGCGHYVIGALACGWDWPAKMADKLGGYYRAAEDATNGATHMSFMEVLDYSIIQPLGGDGGLGTVLHVLGYAVLAGFVVYLMWVWRHADLRKGDFALYWALVTAATPLLSLHAQYYDGALLALPILLILVYCQQHGYEISLRTRVALVVVYVAYLPAAFIPEWFLWFRFQPVFVVPILVCAWAASLIRREERRRAL